MKIRSCFVSNSSSSSFLLSDAETVEEAKERLIEAVASFLSRKATRQRHLTMARKFVNERIRSRTLLTGMAEDMPEASAVARDEVIGKAAIVDLDWPSIVAEFGDADSWEEDEDLAEACVEQAGFKIY